MSLNINFRRKPPRPVLAMLSLAALLAVLAVGTFGRASSADVLGYLAAPPAPGSQGTNTNANAQNPQAADGFTSLSVGQQARSMSSLVNGGLVHPQPVNAKDEGDKSIQNPQLSTIVWGAPANMSQSTGSNEPAAAIHPTNPLLALGGGNASSGARIHNTATGGVTWTSRAFPNCSTYGDGVVAWLASTFNGGDSAIGVSLCNVGGAGQMRLSASTDQGASWANATANGLPTAGFSGSSAVVVTYH